MTRPLKIAMFGSSLVSAYWNGAATYYRGILRALSLRGHQITFYEPDAYDRQAHRDIPDPPWARVVVYPCDEGGLNRALEAAADADIVIKASGVGVFDEELEARVVELHTGTRRVAYWDVDAPATLERVQTNPKDPFRALIPRYDLVLTYGGGDPVVRVYQSLGARMCLPIYNALDPLTHHPVPPEGRFQGDLAFLGNRLPDREARVEQFFLGVAQSHKRQKFVLGGAGWERRALPPNVRYTGHVYTYDHNAFNCSPRMVININRESMARFGFSPPTRIFEAAGAGACLITDAWPGIDHFLEPGREVLVAHDAEDISRYLRDVSPERARRIGHAALKRVLLNHTYAHRAVRLEAFLEEHHLSGLRVAS